jgi:hypothetical protein
MTQAKARRFHRNSFETVKVKISAIWPILHVLYMFHVKRRLIAVEIKRFSNSPGRLQSDGCGRKRGRI